MKQTSFLNLNANIFRKIQILCLLYIRHLNIESLNKTNKNVSWQPKAIKFDTYLQVIYTIYFHCNLNNFD